MNKNGFWWNQGEAYCESLKLRELAETQGTPLYVYSQAEISDRCHKWKAAFSHYPTLSCFAVKANFNPLVLKTIFQHGFGADVVSGGELEAALNCGANPKQIVFSGVGKQEDEIGRGIEVGILSFHIESEDELNDIRRIAKEKNKIASVSFRVNPHIDVKTHPHIATGLYETKFGIAENEVKKLSKNLIGDSWVKLVGLSCHLGSQITEVAPYTTAAERLSQLAFELKAMGASLSFLDLGGGLGIKYREEIPIRFEDFSAAILPIIKKTELKLVLEPGRCLIAEAGVLVSKVIRTKSSPTRKFVIIDAGMNDLIRPSLYGAYHEIEAVTAKGGELGPVDIVGPVCETSDCFGESRPMRHIEKGEYVMIRNAGAYGSSMASHYNLRKKAKEILVEGMKVSS